MPLAPLQIIPQEEFSRVTEAPARRLDALELIAGMCRYNTIVSVKRAGSGHLGTSFSAMDLLVWLYYERLNTVSVGLDDPSRDIFFSSKGHDVPALYSVLYSLGVVPREKLLKLRRHGGLDGHPNVAVRGIEANSGSLGMGISKARGMAWAKRYLRRGGHVFVMTGDGELQEGQNYEGLRSAARQGIANITAIVDHNKVQSDKPVAEIMDVGDVRATLETFGWHAVRCDGHRMQDIARAFDDVASVTDRPTAVVADTIKGRGVSFMEHPRALRDGAGYYRWHAGAPDDAAFAAAELELRTGIISKATALGLSPIQFDDVERQSGAGARSGELGEPQSAGAMAGRTAEPQVYVVDAYGAALVDIASTRPDLVVLDADLAADCRVRAFELAFPDRFIQNGIAEQDMVSMAGGLARQGLLPVVNSFASFLASRANEQIYNNATENGRIIYACHYAGLIPAGPGMSHQSLRDISLLGALPGVAILQPCNAVETRLALEYCVNEAKESCALRLAIGPSPRRIDLPADYVFAPGIGAVLRPGDDAMLIAYGPVMLHEALTAAEVLANRGFSLSVVNMPWLNRFNETWLAGAVASHESVFVLEDHSPVGGLGDRLLARLSEMDLMRGMRCEVFGVSGHPACGTPVEALAHHALDGSSLARRVEDALTSASPRVSVARG